MLWHYLEVIKQNLPIFGRMAQISLKERRLSSHLRFGKNEGSHSWNTPLRNYGKTRRRWLTCEKNGFWMITPSDILAWGITKGFVIPCFIEKSLSYIKIRQIEKEPKYIHIRGSAPALFGTDSLFGAPLILLTEGEFDCMLTWQLLQDVAGVATLGSANKKLDLTSWIRYLLPAEEIIAVLDNDHAGKLGAQNLAGLSAQIHPVRIPSLSPAGKDITDYVQAGGDLWEWLKHHLVRIETLSSFNKEFYV